MQIWTSAVIWLSTIVLANGDGKGKFDRSVLGNLKGQSGSMSVKVDRTHAFVASIGLGNPPQELKCLVDSGSADLWVPSKRCKDCGSKNHFFADSSSTFTPTLVQTPQGPRPRAYQVSYGSGSVTGFGVEDTFTFGPWKVKNQSFIIVEDQALPPSMPWDGIFGLGWNGIAKVGKPVYQRMQEAGHPAIFALVPVRKGEARLTLGSVPEADIKASTLVWVNSEDVQLPNPHNGDKHSFWIVSGGVAVTRKKPTKEKFLVDTGTNQMLLVPTKFFPSFIRSLLPVDSFEQHCGMDMSMGNVIVCDCSIGRSGNLPPMRLYLGERQFEVPIPELFTEVGTTNNGKPLCMLQVQPNDMGPQGLDSVIGGLLPGILGGGGSPFGPQGGIAGLPPFPALVPVSGSGAAGPPSGGEQAPSGDGRIQAGLPGFPFKLPEGLEKILKSLPDTKNLKPGEREEEIIQHQPNGDVCTTIVITEPDGTRRKSRKCHHGGGGGLPRRLQGGMPLIEVAPGAMVGQGAPGGMPTMILPGQVHVQESPLGELWVIGGVFMEKFVTIFDFDNKRVGFAEPLNPVAQPQQTNYQQKSASQAFLPKDAVAASPDLAASPVTGSAPAGSAAATSATVASGPVASASPLGASTPAQQVAAALQPAKKGVQKPSSSWMGTMLMFLAFGGTFLCVVVCLMNAPMPWTTRRNGPPMCDDLPGE